MNLVHLRLRHGEAIADARPVEGTGILYFCAKDLCPHYQGQLGLLAGAEAMICALAQHPPDRICQPFYLEVAEALDRNRRQTWEQRLAEAEVFERAVAAGTGSPGVANEQTLPVPILAPELSKGEAVWTRSKSCRS
jgi:hypothetical protein